MMEWAARRAGEIVRVASKAATMNGAIAVLGSRALRTLCLIDGDDKRLAPHVSVSRNMPCSNALQLFVRT